jgi:hypothetical protein
MLLLLTTITDLFILYRAKYTGKYEYVYIYISCVYVDVCCFCFGAWTQSNPRNVCWPLDLRLLQVHHHIPPPPKKDNIFWGCSVGIWWFTLRRLNKKNMGICFFFRNLLKFVDFLDDILIDQSLIKGGAWGLNRQVVEITWLSVGFMVHIWGFHKWGYPKNIQKHRGPRPCRTSLLIWLVTQKTLQATERDESTCLISNWMLQSYGATQSAKLVLYEA